MMIATNVAQAAIVASIEYYEKNKPTPEQAWRASRREHLEEEAAKGDAQARYDLGVLYQVHQDPAAHHWMCQAANLGHPAAQLQLGHWYNEDRLLEDPWPYIGLRPDNRSAYMWYSLAARNGSLAAGPFRDSLEDSALDRDDLEEARAMAEEWTGSGCGVLASVDREALD